VVKGLERAGDTAEAPTLPGHRKEDDRSIIRFDDYVERITQVLQRQPSPVVVVGHSSAGFLMQAAVPLAPERVSHLVFVNAFILPDGKSQFDLVPPEASEAMVAAAKASSDNSVPVMEDFVRNMLMAGEPSDLQDALISKLVPQPLALFTTPVHTGKFDALQITKSVVFCKDDVSLPPGAYLGMASGLGKYHLIEVEGSHEALFTKPQVVVAGIKRALKGLTSAR